MGGGGSSHHDRQGHRHQGQATAQNAGNTWGGPLGGPAQDHHVSVRGFNAAESKDALKSAAAVFEAVSLIDARVSTDRARLAAGGLQIYEAGRQQPQVQRAVGLET
ncbi:hypothetical protein LOZ10_005672, partial [Ophidiomyces ophidiicola]